MTKAELRKVRKNAVAAGQPLVGELALDRDNNTNIEFSAERHTNGKINMRRAKALDRYARYAYENDRD